MTIEFTKPTPQSETKGFLGFGKRKIPGPTPQPVIARPEKSGIKNELTPPSRQLKVRDRSENHIRIMIVRSPESVEVTDYELTPGRQPLKIGETTTFKENSINAQDFVTTGGESVAWRETKPEDPHF